MNIRIGLLLLSMLSISNAFANTDEATGFASSQAVACQQAQHNAQNLQQQYYRNGFRNVNVGSCNCVGGQGGGYTCSVSVSASK